MRALPDVNVLVALLDRQHLAHGRAHAWLAQNLGIGWALCPLVRHIGRLVTFDTGIALNIVRGAMPHQLLVL